MNLTNQIPQNDAGDVAFDGPGAPGQGESGSDGVIILGQPVGDAAESGDVAGLGLAIPA